EEIFVDVEVGLVFRVDHGGSSRGAASAAGGTDLGVDAAEDAADGERHAGRHVRESGADLAQRLDQAARAIGVEEVGLGEVLGLLVEAYGRELEGELDARALRAREELVL